MSHRTIPPFSPVSFPLHFAFSLPSLPGPLIAPRHTQAAGMWAPSGQHPPTSQEGRRVAWSDGEIILVRDGFLRFGKQWVKTLEWGNGLHLDDLPPVRMGQGARGVRRGGVRMHWPGGRVA